MNIVPPIPILDIVREYSNSTAELDSAFEDIGIDSLEFITIIKAVEDALDIIISNDALTRIKTVRDLVVEAEALRIIS